MVLDFVDISTEKQHESELHKWLRLGLLYVWQKYLIGGIT